MRQSNLYIIGFAAILTVVCGGLLALAAVGLGPAQKIAVELDTRRQILTGVMELQPEDDVLAIYNQRIRSLVVNIDGEIVEQTESGEPIIAENIDIASEYKKPPEERLYPVFKFLNENDTTQVEAYILPMYGNGLWNNISGFIALSPDLETIKGARLDHIGETPGLGARITEPEVQERYEGKEIYNDQGELVSVTMLKGENNPEGRLDEYHIDGLSGATITAKGVNAMLENYFGYYQGYLQKVADGEEVASVKQ